MGAQFLRHRYWVEEVLDNIHHGNHVHRFRLEVEYVASKDWKDELLSHALCRLRIEFDSTDPESMVVGAVH